MKRALFWGMLAGAAYAYLASRPVRMTTSRSLDVEPEALLDLVAEVEREPELIPFAQRVTVEERHAPAVVYRVETCILGVPGWARFRKRILPEEGRAEWRSLGGSWGIRQKGRLTCVRRGDRAQTTVVTTTRYTVPVLGPLLGPVSLPFMAYAFNRWLVNLERAAAAPRLSPSEAEGKAAVGESLKTR